MLRRYAESFSGERELGRRSSTPGGARQTKHTQALQRLETDVLAHKPDLVIIQFGINDAMIDVSNDPPATGRRACRDRTTKRTCVSSCGRSAAGGRPRCLLMTPNPLRWVRYLREALRQAALQSLDDPEGFTFILREYAEIVRDVARTAYGPAWVDVYSIFEGVTGRSRGHAGRRFCSSTGRGIPNDGGAQDLSRIRLVEQIIRRKRAGEMRPGSRSGAALSSCGPTPCPFMIAAGKKGLGHHFSPTVGRSLAFIFVYYYTNCAMRARLPLSRSSQLRACRSIGS